MCPDWTEEYRPKGLKDVIGNDKAVRTLESWAKSWDHGTPSKKAVVLIGTPGIGKTSAAVALARDRGWGLVEMNASDQRTGDAIRSIALRGAYSNTFTEDGDYVNSKDGGRKLIVLDEADSLFGREDKGALPAIVELIRETKQPVILIVNDFYTLSKKSAVIKSETLQITFYRPSKDEIVKALKHIADSENVAVDMNALSMIAQNSNGDVRAAVRNLESLALGRTVVTAEDASKLSDRIIKKDVDDLMKAVFRTGNAGEARRLMRDIDESPDHVMLWLDENLPYEFREPGDLVRGYERLSKADVFMGRVRRRQYYRFWSYAGDMMSSGLAISRMGRNPNEQRFRFPSYLMKMSRSKGIRNLKNATCMKLAVMMHTSTDRVANGVLPYLRVILKNDTELRAQLVRDADLEAEELAFIMNEKIDSPAVKDAMKGVVQQLPETTEVAKPAPKKEVPKAQKSLFQF